MFREVGELEPALVQLAHLLAEVREAGFPGRVMFRILVKGQQPHFLQRGPIFFSPDKGWDKVGSFAFRQQLVHRSPSLNAMSTINAIKIVEVLRVSVDRRLLQYVRELGKLFTLLFDSLLVAGLVQPVCDFALTAGKSLLRIVELLEIKRFFIPQKDNSFGGVETSCKETREALAIPKTH